jgi:hypothetical protein
VKKPVPIEIELALARSGGSCRKAARILECTARRVAKYVLQQHNSGRKLDRLKPRRTCIEIEINGNAPHNPLTGSELLSLTALQEFMAEELAS